ncbi:MAG: KAP family NTPase [Clostridium sp.]|nr:KAP family NTPase [Clostridium sp.]
MTEIELNNYIKHYLEEDKTHTAIMLTGEWGSGKTYYVENFLVPFLQDKNQKSRCIIVSLYGIENISDINKSIYMDLRMKAFEINSEAKATGKLIAKTIIKGTAEILGFDINMSEDDLQNLYSSVDLNGKLLVFEDLERSSIELIRLLGYINNLVERDGVKILIVANENEILNKTMEAVDFSTLLVNVLKDNEKENNEKNTPENVQRYLRIKEKTISDTIRFESNYNEAVKNIIDNFDNQKIKEIIKKDGNVVEELASMVQGVCHKNLRTFIYATQKTVDIFNKMQGNYDKSFLKCIYFGIISFSAKIKEGEWPAWQGAEYLSTILGTNQYPLFKFCYDYIRWQRIEEDKIVKTKDAYEKMKLYDQEANQNDKDLRKLYSYSERTEKEVREVLKNIENRLNDSNDIGFYNYGELAAYLIKVAHTIEFDYTKCKECMIQNIRGKGDSIDSELLFLPIYDFEEEKEKEELENFYRQMAESMNVRNSRKDFSYNPDEIANLRNHVIADKPRLRKEHVFLSEYNIDRIVEMLFHASAKQIHTFREVLFEVYRNAGKADFIDADIVAMKETYELVQEKINSQEYDIDKIQIQQLKWLCSNLKTFISQMS